ncbi:MAG: NAD-dependent epimerase/dehydratase family protein [Chthoniobacterales bacterium]
MILVTGATGHLGANLLRLLIAQGEPVRVLVRQSSNLDSLGGLEIEKVLGDLRDPESLRAVVRDCDRIYHCAALVTTAENRKRELFETNVVGTRNLLRAALNAGVRRVVVSGSLSAVGQPENRQANEDDAFDPFAAELPYAHSKAWAEHECLKAAGDGLAVVIATSCAIIGPHDYVPSRVGRTLIDFAEGRMRFYVPGGFEFVSAHDIARGHFLAMERGRSGQRYIFSTEFLTMDEMLDLWASVTGTQTRPRRLPPHLVYAGATVFQAVSRLRGSTHAERFTPGAIRLLQLQRRVDIGKARTELGYEPTSIREAVTAAYEDFVRRRLIASSPR